MSHSRSSTTHISEEMNPEELLSILLSDKEVISSSTTQRLRSTHSDDPTYRCIGAGSCGVIYECTGTSVAFKLARHDNPQLWNDYKTHARVLATFKTHRELTTDIHVPQCHLFIRPDDIDWWANNLPNFPPDVHPTKTLCTERIPPLPKPIRDALVTAYSPPYLQHQARTDLLNADCLARIYLGRRRRRPQADPVTATARPQRFFTLRNFPLHLDQLINLRLDIDAFARTMAATLAVMHWAAHTDADDVEFVLGGKPPFPSHVQELDADAIWEMEEDTSTLRLTTPQHNDRGGRVQMWLLDFNLCGTIAMDESGVEKAVRAFFKNDPYFPRPGHEGARDQRLWETFRGEYLRVSGMVLRDASEEWRGLPRRFVERVEEEQRMRLARRAGEMTLEVSAVE